MMILARAVFVNGILSITYHMHDFIFVDNGFDALLAMKTHDPDIYLVSLDLPQVYLAVVAHEIKVLGKENHSIAMYLNFANVTDKYLEAGIRYHVSKPVNVNQLFTKVDEIIEGIFFGRMCRRYNQ